MAMKMKKLFASLALMALAFPKHEPGAGHRRALLIGLGVFGAALLYGDGMITPVISVLGAMEGLHVATPAFGHFVIPLTILTLIALFAAQSRSPADSILPIMRPDQG
jgi:KUP system potassium uptake protein